MSKQMSDSQWRDFIRHGTRTGKLATVRVDGSPHVTVQGRVRLSEDLDEMRLWSARIAERYVGKELAAAYGDRNTGAGELLVRLPAEKVVAFTGIAD